MALSSFHRTQCQTLCRERSLSVKSDCRTENFKNITFPFKQPNKVGQGVKDCISQVPAFCLLCSPYLQSFPLFIFIPKSLCLFQGFFNFHFFFFHLDTNSSLSSQIRYGLSFPELQCRGSVIQWLGTQMTWVQIQVLPFSEYVILTGYLILCASVYSSVKESLKNSAKRTELILLI